MDPSKQNSTNMYSRKQSSSESLFIISSFFSITDTAQMTREQQVGRYRYVFIGFEFFSYQINKKLTIQSGHYYMLSPYDNNDQIKT